MSELKKRNPKWLKEMLGVSTNENIHIMHYTDSRLELCPFCGSVPVMEEVTPGIDGCKIMRGPSYQVQCSNKKSCGIAGKPFDAFGLAMKWWNRRIEEGK